MKTYKIIVLLLFFLCLAQWIGVPISLASTPPDTPATSDMVHESAKTESPEARDSAGPAIRLNLKGAKFGDVLRALAAIRPLNYSIASVSSTGQISPGSGAPPAQPTAYNPQSGGGQGQTATQLYDTTVSFAYSGNSVDEAVRLLCKGADVYCEKQEDLWVISKLEVFFIDKDIFFSYNISGGSGAGGSSAGSSNQTGSTGTTGSTGVGSTGSSGSLPAVTSSGSSSSGASSVGSDGVSISGNFDDYLSLINTFLSHDGKAQLSKQGYLVVVDRPSAISRLKQFVKKDNEMNDRVTIKVDVVRIDLKDNYGAGVNWNATFKNLTVNGQFSPSNAMSFGYNTTLAGKAISTMLGMLGTYGNTKIVQSWTARVKNGMPIFFNVVENVPYFTQFQLIGASGLGQASTSVNYVSVGLKLKIIPNIRKDSLVGGVYAELSELVSMDSSGGSTPTTAPETSLTNIDPPFDIPWGKSVVLTGFKTKERDNLANGIPFLSKIPIIGALFGYQEKDSIGSELAIIVTANKAVPYDEGMVEHEIK